MARTAMAYEIPYVATATIADLRDLEYRVEKAMSLRGARRIHALIPCPLGWGSSSNSTVTLARLATQIGLFPVFEAEGGEVTSITKIRRPMPVEEYLRPQRWFARILRGPGLETLIARPQAIADRNISRYGLVEMDTLDEDTQCRILQAPRDPTGRLATARACPAPIPIKPPSPTPSIVPNSAPSATAYGSASPTPQPVPSAP